MNEIMIIEQLAGNLPVFETLFGSPPAALIGWRPHPEKWSLVEIVNHLYDEEREDFRQFLKLVLEDPSRPWPSIAPRKWVSERRYADRDYDASLANFLTERRASVTWLNQLEHPDWQATHIHAKLGPMSAEKLLVNWLAHDYHHIRQANALKYEFLRQQAAPVSLAYAGDW